MLHAQRLLIYSAPLKVVAIHRPILLLASPSNAVAQARAGQGARGVHASTPDSRDKRRRSHFQREYTEPKEEEPNKMEGDAISSVYILLYAATITTLSLSVYTVCVCVHLMKDRARSSREPGGFIQYDGAAYRSYSRQSIQRQASVMMSPSRS
jgi:hypothetical protein